MPPRASASRGPSPPLRPGPRCLVFLLPLLVTLAPSAASAADWAPNLTTTAVWQDNATNADRSTDIVGGLAWQAGLSAARTVVLPGDDTLTFGGRLGTEVWPRFDGLDQLTAGLQSAWRRKFGLGPDAPALTVTLAAGAIGARESARSGFAARVALTGTKRFGDATLVELTQEFSRLDARGAVFDRDGAETSVGLRQTLNENWTVGAVARLRFGDVLSYGTPPRPDLVALARVRTTVNTFGRPMVAYSFEARTLAGGLSVTRRIGDHTTLALAADYRATAKAALRYVNRLVSATLTHQF